MATIFRERLAEPGLLIGSFVKTAAPSVIEIAAVAGLDFVVIDSEHAPFSPGDIDRGILAGRATGIAVLVRVPDAGGPWVQQALDMGADGVLVPHVSSTELARAVVAASRFRGGSRGFSNSPRAGRYGRTSMTDYLVQEDRRTAVIVQIEDAAAIDAIDAIVKVDGIDALFVGPADLAVSLGADGPGAEQVVEATRLVSRAAAAAGLPWGTFQASYASVAGDPGFVVIGSDQNMMRTGWERLVSESARG